MDILDFVTLIANTKKVQKRRIADGIVMVDATERQRVFKAFNTAIDIACEIATEIQKTEITDLSDSDK